MGELVIDKSCFHQLLITLSHFEKAALSNVFTSRKLLVQLFWSGLLLRNS